jgi:hypothetical protein
MTIGVSGTSAFAAETAPSVATASKTAPGVVSTRIVPANQMPELTILEVFCADEFGGGVSASVTNVPDNELKTFTMRILDSSVIKVLASQKLSPSLPGDTKVFGFGGLGQAPMHWRREVPTGASWGSC